MMTFLCSIREVAAPPSNSDFFGCDCQSKPNAIDRHSIRALEQDFAHAQRGLSEVASCRFADNEAIVRNKMGHDAGRLERDTSSERNSDRRRDFVR